MVKDHSDRERGNPLPPHRLLFWLAATVLLYSSSHRQDNTYHGLCYTNRGALAGTRNSPMGPPWRIDPTSHRTMNERSYHGATSRSLTEYNNVTLILSHQEVLKLLLASLIHLAPPWRIDPTTHRTMNERSYHGTASRSLTEYNNVMLILIHQEVLKLLLASLKRPSLIIGSLLQMFPNHTQLSTNSRGARFLMLGVVRSELTVYLIPPWQRIYLKHRLTVTVAIITLFQTFRTPRISHQIRYSIVIT